MKPNQVASVLVLVVLIYGGFIFWSDVSALRDAIGRYEWWTFFASLGLAFGNYVLRFAKWEFYLRRLGVRGVPWRESFTIFLSGFALSVTPAKAGEVFKSALLQSARGVPISRSAPIVVADRLTDLVALIMMVAAGGMYFRGGGYVALGASTLVAVILLFVTVRPLAEWALRLVERVPVGKRVAPRLREAYDALRVLASPSALLLPTAVSVVAWALEALGLWIIAKGLGLSLSAPVAAFVSATATLAGAVAMLPGGLGGTEIVMQRLLRDIAHATGSTASTATLLVRISTLWFAVGVGVLALAWFRRAYDRKVGPGGSPSER
ncbi:MAG: lysylphosphatidylglycerol synthase transmembrane domain-containing protein [Polyangiales bacterium]